MKKHYQPEDIYPLYEQAVQAPDHDVQFFQKIYRTFFNERATALREDFGGTGYLSSTWCNKHRTHHATAIDLDPRPQEYGMKHHAHERLNYVCADVRNFDGQAYDIACAMNFSYNVFHQRTEILAYFKNVFASLKDRGVFILELYGGTEAITELEEEREQDGFTYIWEQASFDPISHKTTCYIHFKQDDGPTIEKAFHYDWRYWTMPELIDLLHEAGFRDHHIYWEQVDEDDPDEDGVCYGNGEYELQTQAEQQTSWIAYLVGVKR